MRYNVGDTVRISKKSFWHGYCESNPKDTDGKVDRINEAWSHPIRVEWENGKWARFREEDLKLRRRG